MGEEHRVTVTQPCMQGAVAPAKLKATRACRHASKADFAPTTLLIERTWKCENLPAAARIQSISKLLSGTCI